MSITEAPPEAPRSSGPTTSDHLSYSQMSMYLRCSMQYYFRYVLGWISPPSLPLARGKAGHTAIETNSLHKIKTGADSPVDHFLDIASDAYDAETNELLPEHLREDEDIGKSKDGHIELLRFWRLGEAPKDIPMAVELEFDLTVPPSDVSPDPIPKIVGRIDELTADRNGNPDHLGDYKFAYRAKSQGDVDTSMQLDLYDTVLREEGITVAQIGYKTMLQANTREGPRLQRLPRSAALMTPEIRQNRTERIFYKARAIWRGITGGIFIPTDDPRTCATCGFREQCQFSLVRSDWKALEIRQRMEKQ